MSLKIEFKPSGRGKAQCPPNPAYPNGIEMDARVVKQAKSCTADLPYPAPECGMWIVECEVCYMRVAITAAGRPDDPTRVTFNCENVEAVN
jgi:hypothetical protein